MGYERNFGNVTFNVIQNPPNYAVISVLVARTSEGNVYPFTPTTLVRWPAPAAPAVVTPSLCRAHLASRNRACAQCSRTFLPPTPSSGRRPSTARSCGTRCSRLSTLGPRARTVRHRQPERRRLRLGIHGRCPYRQPHQLPVHQHQLSRQRRLQQLQRPEREVPANNLFNKGLYLIANYTWSHAIDNLSSTFSDGTAGVYGLGYSIPSTPTWTRATPTTTSATGSCSVAPGTCRGAIT